MSNRNKRHLEKKSGLHSRNKHCYRYDFQKLIDSCPELSAFVRLNIYNDESIDFSNPEAVKTLNKALLKHYYDIDYWDIPKGFLCPPIPGRADYIHHIADLLGSLNDGRIPQGNKVKCLDVGTGANCVYPIIGVKEYDWEFTATDIDPVSIKSAKKILELNAFLYEKVELRIQHNPEDIFNGIIQKGELFDLSICNPPFHSTIKEARAGTQRKLNNLNKKKTTQVRLNFGGQSNELWCKGGECRFVSIMILQSRQFSSSCLWFSSLVSKQSNLKKIYSALDNAKAAEVKTIPMGQGNKISRIVAWTFLTSEQQKSWAKRRWN